MPGPEAILDVVIRMKRGFGAPDAEIRAALEEIGCTRVLFRDDSVIAFYRDRSGKITFIECSPLEFMPD